MKRTGMKWAATVACSMSVLVLCASVGNAGIIPWVWDVVFGPNCPQNRCYSAPSGVAYAPSPCGPSGCGVQQAFFAPFTSCSPCNSSLCGVSGCQTGACGPAGCPTGQCGLSPATSARTSAPVGDPTFGAGAATPKTKGWQTKGDKAPMPEEDGAEATKAYKPPTETTPVPGKNGAADTLPFGDDDQDADAGKEADVDKETEAGEKEGANGPKLYSPNVATTWRPTVGRTRLKRPATYASARIIRKPRHAKGKWMAVPSTENIAKR